MTSQHRIVLHIINTNNGEGDKHSFNKMSDQENVISFLNKSYILIFLAWIMQTAFGEASCGRTPVGSDGRIERHQIDS